MDKLVKRLSRTQSKIGKYFNKIDKLQKKVDLHEISILNLKKIEDAILWEIRCCRNSEDNHEHSEQNLSGSV